MTAFPTVADGFIVGYFHWRVIFLVNLPIGLVGIYLVWRHVPDYCAAVVHRLDVDGMILFGLGIGLLSYVLEVFGEHTLRGREILVLLALSVLLLAGYYRHAGRSTNPLLDLHLFRTRTFRSAVSGNFVTRLGAAGIPFLLPLLYQVGLGYTPVQSGLLLMPQSLAAIGFKMTMPIILTKFGYRTVLLSNTILLGTTIVLFATIHHGTPVYVIVILAACFGFVASLQYTSMNTLAYADIRPDEASMASTIASTVQQMSLSFGVAAASLVVAVFIPDRFRSNPAEMIDGIHDALIALGSLTLVSALVFLELRTSDGASVSQYAIHTGA